MITVLAVALNMFAMKALYLSMGPMRELASLILHGMESSQCVTVNFKYLFFNLYVKKQELFKLVPS